MWTTSLLWYRSVWHTNQNPSTTDLPDVKDSRVGTGKETAAGIYARSHHEEAKEQGAKNQDNPTGVSALGSCYLLLASY